MHGKGVTDYSAIAQEAGVSAATVRKHFPTQEDMFRGCTAHFMRTYTLPSLEKLEAIEDLSQRVVVTVQEICALYKASFGQVWLSFKLQEESAVMAETRKQGDAFIEAAVDMILKDYTDSSFSARLEHAGFLKAMLSPLTYRSFRLHGGLTPEKCEEQICGAILMRLGLKGESP